MNGIVVSKFMNVNMFIVFVYIIFSYLVFYYIFIDIDGLIVGVFKLMEGF